MNTSVSFAVQAHPDRSLAAHRLAAEIGGEVVFDPEPDAEIRSPRRSFRHLLDTTPEWATHRLQIQDDATVCPGFAAAVERAVAARPDRVLVFFVGRANGVYARDVLSACRNDLPWAELRVGQWIPVVASCWPADLARGMVAWYDEQRWPPKFVADDEVAGKYLKSIGHRPLASVPSLVEHLDVLPTLLPRKMTAQRYRNAVCFVGDCTDCIEGIDWDLGPGASVLVG